MADQKPEAKPILKRCGERLSIVRLATDWGGAYMFGGQSVLHTEPKMDGTKVEWLALHPAGVAVAYKGKRYVIPGAKVEVSIVAPEEQ